MAPSTASTCVPSLRFGPLTGNEKPDAPRRRASGCDVQQHHDGAGRTVVSVGDCVLEHLAGLEGRVLARGDGDAFSSARADAAALLAVADLEGTETGELDFLAFLQVGADRVQDVLYGRSEERRVGKLGKLVV